LQLRRQLEIRVSHPDAVIKATELGLRFGIYAIAHRTALHEDDRLVAIFPCNRCR